MTEPKEHWRARKGTTPSSRAGARRGSRGRPLPVEALSGAILVATLVAAAGWDAPKIVDGTIDLKNATASNAGDGIKQLLFPALFLLAVWLRAFVVGGRVLNAIPFVFLPVLAWCWLSLFWSVDMDATLRRLVLTTLVIVTVSCCVANLGYYRTVNSLSTALFAIVAANWIAVALFSHAVHGAGEIDKALVGNWRGFHNNKNEAGAIAALALIVFTYEAIRTRSLMTGGISIALAAVFLYQSNSKTAMALVVVALLIGALVYGIRRFPSVRWGGLMLLGAVVVPLCIAYGESILDDAIHFLSDPTSLTGRAKIWSILLNAVDENPLLGTGFGSFWGTGSDTAIRRYSSDWIAQLYSAHSGYLELLVQTGFVGLGLAVAFLVLIPVWALFTKSPVSHLSRSMLCSVLAFGWLRDVLESSLLDRANPTWIITVVAYCLLFRDPGQRLLSNLRLGGASALSATALRRPS